MKSTRFSEKISSDPTKKSGRKTPLPYKAKTGIFSPAAPKNRRRPQKSAPRQKNRRRAPRARRICPPAPGPPRPAAARRIWPRVPPAPPRPPRRRATARPARPRPPRAPCARTGAALFFAAPLPGPARLRPTGSRRRAPRPARPPKARRRPARAQKKARRPRRAPGRPRAPAPGRTARAPKGGSNSRARFRGDRGPLSREFPRNLGPGGYAPKIKKRQKKSGEKKKSSCPCGQMPQMAR